MLIKVKLKKCQKINKELLKLIAKTKSIEVNDTNQKISKTDWGILPEEKSDYAKYFINTITPCLGNLANMHSSNKWLIDNLWFQQYKKGDFHNWHAHSKTNFSAVYYIELFSQEAKTQFLNQQSIGIEEGDLILFPGFWYHRSEKLKDKRKTVISFNCSFWDYHQRI